MVKSKKPAEPKTAPVRTARSQPDREAIELPPSVLQPAQKMIDILVAADTVITHSGMSRLSIREVCSVAKVAPGTFYRHFSSREDLLDVYTRYKREAFHESLHAAVASVTDPDQRFIAVLDHISRFLDKAITTQLLRMEPDYALEYLQNIFSDSAIRFQELLRESFDQWELRLGIKLDRPLLCELLMRYVVSERMVPSQQSGKRMAKRIARMIGPLLVMAASRNPRR